MTSIHNLHLLIREKKWYEIMASYSPQDIVQSLSFCECIQLADDLLDEKLWDFDLKVYSAKLLEAVRHHYPQDWQSSWKYDACLGQVYDLTLDYDGRYEAFQRAYDQSKSHPYPHLLIGLAGCYCCPGKPPVFYSQVVEYLQFALKNNLYQDGIGVMRGACAWQKMKQREAYWAFLYNLLLEIGCPSPDIEIDYLQKKEPQPSQKLEEILDQKLRKVVSTYNPDDILKKLSFREALHLAYALLYNQRWDRKLHEYSVELLEALRKHYSTEWSASWRNDGFLAMAYFFTLKPQKRYEALQRAFELTTSQPAELLIALASCCLCEDGEPPITYDQALDYLKQAVKNHPYKDAVWLLYTISEFKKDSQNEKLWGDVYNTLPAKADFSPPLEPEFLQHVKAVDEEIWGKLEI